jgi:hypothetical protein
MKNLFIFLGLSITVLTGCSSDSVQPTSSILVYNVNLSGANEVPANASASTGSVSGTYNKTTKILTLGIRYAGFTPTAWHIHKAAAGTNGGVLVNFGTTFVSPFSYTSTALTPEQETDLLAGLWYVNVHSATFPGGEIRAQLVEQK